MLGINFLIGNSSRKVFLVVWYQFCTVCTFLYSHDCRVVAVVTVKTEVFIVRIWIMIVIIWILSEGKEYNVHYLLVNYEKHVFDAFR